MYQSVWHLMRNYKHVNSLVRRFRKNFTPWIIGVLQYFWKNLIVVLGDYVQCRVPPFLSNQQQSVRIIILISPRIDQWLYQCHHKKLPAHGQVFIVNTSSIAFIQLHAKSTPSGHLTATLCEVGVISNFADIPGSDTWGRFHCYSRYLLFQCQLSISHRYTLALYSILPGQWTIRHTPERWPIAAHTGQNERLGDVLTTCYGGVTSRQITA